MQSLSRGILCACGLLKLVTPRSRPPDAFGRCRGLSLSRLFLRSMVGNRTRCGRAAGVAKAREIAIIIFRCRESG